MKNRHWHGRVIMSAAIVLLALLPWLPGALGGPQQTAIETQSAVGESAALQEFLDRMKGFGRRGLFGSRAVDRHVRNEAGQVVELRLDKVELRPGDATLIGTLKQLERIDLSETNVSDDDLGDLTQLDGLRHLSLRRTNISGKALVHVGGLTGLEELDLASTKVTDEDLPRLDGLKQLRVLSLRYTRITDQGLSIVANFRQLTRLSLGSTKITDAGLRQLEELPQLRALTLDGTQVTDVGLKRLSSRPVFSWMAAPDLTVSEFLQRLELGQFESAREMYVAGPFVAEKGSYHVIGMKSLEPTEKDRKAGRNRFQIELQWKKDETSQDSFLHVTLAIDRGCVSILEVGLDE